MPEYLISRSPGQLASNGIELQVGAMTKSEDLFRLQPEEKPIPYLLQEVATLRQIRFS